MKDSVKELLNDLNRKIDDMITEGLKRKGHEFSNKSEVESFIMDRCRYEDDPIKKEKIYFVDNTPFLLHKYNQEYNTHVSNNGSTINATIRGYVYL